ncbi:hypothetical protein GGD81_004236 [Rhodobium orientis]|uniref:Uncharacterized protein n=1 Tax=Rhodobium orientis TaxID=34017 RepID=A0A327JL83_9HYPH|nr:hypothetical protein [Rhodobium orientis]MBB4305167.1 hypothetical protein [Rhodobium orientis]MBK5949239.1 hypothetical protein [Rhodobium orientis]RAI26655.1 hypothetical protein CH339_12965 [Rhodobium orientis]
MRRIFAIVLRSLWVIVVYLIAAYVAGAVVTLSAGTEWAALRDPYLDPTTAMIETALLVGLAGSYLGAAFLIPATVAIIASEIFSVRGALSHLLGGLAVAAVSSVTTNIVPHTHVSAFRAWELLLAAGVLAGAVYWLLAGRNAGKWQKVGNRPQAAQQNHAGEGV